MLYYYLISLIWVLVSFYVGTEAGFHAAWIKYRRLLKTRKRREVRLEVSFDLSDIVKVPVEIVGAVDAEGALTTIPPDTTFDWEMIPVNGDNPGTFVVDADDQTKGVLEVGTAGDSGYLKVTAYLPDGSSIVGQSETWNAVPSAPVGFRINFGDPI
jgi:hypothetical protein